MESEQKKEKVYHLLLYLRFLQQVPEMNSGAVVSRRENRSEIRNGRSCLFLNFLLLTQSDSFNSKNKLQTELQSLHSHVLEQYI